MSDLLTWHNENLAMFDTNAELLAANAKQIRRNERFLRWWGWLGFTRWILEPAHENLLYQDQRLKDADARLRAEDARRMSARRG